jgi:hypothetical protein
MWRLLLVALAAAAAGVLPQYFGAPLDRGHNFRMPNRAAFSSSTEVVNGTTTYFFSSKRMNITNAGKPLRSLISLGI